VADVRRDAPGAPRGCGPIRLYWRLLLVNLYSQMQHKASFFLLTLGQFGVSFTAFLGIWFLMDRFHTVGGFDLPQVMLCYAIVLVAFSVSEMFFRGFDTFPRMLGNGVFDRVLVRPRNTIFLVLGMEMDFTRLGRTLQAIAMLIYALPRCGVIWTPVNVATLVLMIISGAAVFSALQIIYAALSFFTVEGLEFMNILTHGGTEHGRYPFAIYGEGVLKFLTYIVPLALFQYYPLLALIGQEDTVWNRLAPIPALLFLFPAYILWRIGLRKFKSTGS
jgi:ABC-2 type transport system permease protein